MFKDTLGALPASAMRSVMGAASNIRLSWTRPVIAFARSTNDMPGSKLKSSGKVLENGPMTELGAPTILLPSLWKKLE
ncbi:MAG: hypothetical protein AAFQ06_10130, partial [Pseudomonadota bacterium]